jgi:hypothetical protein
LTMMFPEDVQVGAFEGSVADAVGSKVLVVPKSSEDATVTVEVAVKVIVDLIQLGGAAWIVVVIADDLTVTVLDLTSVKVLNAVVVIVDGLTVVSKVFEDATVTVEVAVRVTVDLVQLMTLQLGVAA